MKKTESVLFLLGNLAFAASVIWAVTHEGMIIKGAVEHFPPVACLAFAFVGLALGAAVVINDDIKKGPRK